MGRMLDRVARLDDDGQMKTALDLQVRVESEWCTDRDSAPIPSETLTVFVEASAHRAVEFHGVESDFAARCAASLAADGRTGLAIPSDVVLSTLEASVAATVKPLGR